MKIGVSDVEIRAILLQDSPQGIDHPVSYILPTKVQQSSGWLFLLVNKLIHSKYKNQALQMLYCNHYICSNNDM